MLQLAADRDIHHAGTDALVVALFEGHHAEVYAYLCRLLGDADAAQDLTQETFLRALRAADRLPAVANRRAWVYRIATNLAFTWLRRRRRFAWLPWEAGDALRLTGPDTARQVDGEAVLEAALHTLPAEYRAALLLHAWYEWSVREIAEATGTSEGSVKMRLYRGREMLRRALTREGEG